MSSTPPRPAVQELWGASSGLHASIPPPPTTSHSSRASRAHHLSAGTAHRHPSLVSPSPLQWSTRTRTARPIIPSDEIHLNSKIPILICRVLYLTRSWSVVFVCIRLWTVETDRESGRGKCRFRACSLVIIIACDANDAIAVRFACHCCEGPEFLSVGKLLHYTR